MSQEENSHPNGSRKSKANRSCRVSTDRSNLSLIQEVLDAGPSQGTRSKVRYVFVPGLEVLRRRHLPLSEHLRRGRAALPTRMTRRTRSERELDVVVPRLRRSERLANTERRQCLRTRSKYGHRVSSSGVTSTPTGRSRRLKPKRLQDRFPPSPEMEIDDPNVAFLGLPSTTMEVDETGEYFHGLPPMEVDSVESFQGTRSAPMEVDARQSVECFQGTPSPPMEVKETAFHVFSSYIAPTAAPTQRPGTSHIQGRRDLTSAPLPQSPPRQGPEFFTRQPSPPIAVNKIVKAIDVFSSHTAPPVAPTPRDGRKYIQGRRRLTSAPLPQSPPRQGPEFFTRQPSKPIVVDKIVKAIDVFSSHTAPPVAPTGRPGTPYVQRRRDLTSAPQPQSPPRQGPEFFTRQPSPPIAVDKIVEAIDVFSSHTAPPVAPTGRPGTLHIQGRRDLTSAPLHQSPPRQGPEFFTRQPSPPIAVDKIVEAIDVFSSHTAPPVAPTGRPGTPYVQRRRDLTSAPLPQSPPRQGPEFFTCQPSPPIAVDKIVEAIDVFSSHTAPPVAPTGRPGTPYVQRRRDLTSAPLPQSPPRQGPEFFTRQPSPPIAVDKIVEAIDVFSSHTAPPVAPTPRDGRKYTQGRRRLTSAPLPQSPPRQGPEFFTRQPSPPIAVDKIVEAIDVFSSHTSPPVAPTGRPGTPYVQRRRDLTSAPLHQSPPRQGPEFFTRQPSPPIAVDKIVEAIDVFSSHTAPPVATPRGGSPCIRGRRNLTPAPLPQSPPRQGAEVFQHQSSPRNEQMDLE